MLVTNGGKQAVANAFAVLCDPGDEVLVPAPYWTTYPESIALAGGVPVAVPTDDAHGFCVDGRRAGGGHARRGRRCCSSSRRPTPPGPSTAPSEIAAIGRWAVRARHLGGLPTRSTSTSSTAAPSTTRCPSWSPSWPTAASWCNGVAKTYAMTGWRVGWMLGPPTRSMPRPTSSRHETSNVANVSQRAALAAVSGDLAAVAVDARGLRPSPPDHARACSTRSTASTCLEPERRVLRLPQCRRACSARRCAGSGRDHVAELAEVCIDEAKVAVVPGEAFGAPGYFRLSYALGDDDLAEGVGRLATLFAEARRARTPPRH